MKNDLAPQKVFDGSKRNEFSKFGGNSKKENLIVTYGSLYSEILLNAIDLYRALLSGDYCIRYCPKKCAKVWAEIQINFAD